jgi:hypothetical protein
MDWIVKNWVTEEREEVRKTMSDPDTHAHNKAQVSRSKGLFIHGTVFHQDYAIVLTKDHADLPGPGLPLTFKKTPEGWKRTNALMKDEMLDVIFAAFNDGTVSKK